MNKGSLLFSALGSVACVVFLVCLVAHAEPAADSKKIQNIKKLIAVQGGMDEAKRYVDQMFSALVGTLPPELTGYVEAVKKEIDENALMEIMANTVRLYDKYLTDEEVSLMLKFSDSPDGGLILQKMIQIASESDRFSSDLAGRIVPKAVDKIEGLAHHATSGDVTKLAQLLDSGRDVNERDARGVTALMVAAYRDNTDMAKLLVEKGADVNAKTKKGSTALMSAVQSGNKELVKFLLDKGADANAKEELGLNAYHIALVQKKHELAALLKSRTSDIRPARPGFVVAASGKAKDCVPIMNLPDDSSKKIKCLRRGEEVATVPGVHTNNGWTLIQFPAVGWVPPQSLKQELVIGEHQRRIAREPRESFTDDSVPAENLWVESPASYEKTPGDESAIESVEAPHIWWRR